MGSTWSSPSQPHETAAQRLAREPNARRMPDGSRRCRAGCWRSAPWEIGGKRYCARHAVAILDGEEQS